MPTSLENAYLLILGQILLLVAAITVGIFTIAFGDEQLIVFEFSNYFGLFFVSTVCLYLFVNIIFCWVATRSAIETLDNYHEKLFALDVLLICVFFTINNLVFFMMGSTIKTDLVANNLQSVLEAGWQEYSIYYSLVYLLSTIHLLLTKAWNNYFYKLSKPRENIPSYEKILSLIIFFLGVVFLLSIFFHGEYKVQILLWLFWVAAFLYIDISWIRSEIMSLYGK